MSSELAVYFGADVTYFFSSSIYGLLLLHKQNGITLLSANKFSSLWQIKKWQAFTAWY